MVKLFLRRQVCDEQDSEYSLPVGGEAEGRRGRGRSALAAAGVLATSQVFSQAVDSRAFILLSCFVAYRYVMCVLLHFQDFRSS